MQEVFFVSGQAASGKSQFTKVLAAARGLTIVDFDDTLQKTIEKHSVLLAEIGMEKFLAQVGPERYEDLIARALSEFNQGKSIVLEAPFSKQIADQHLWDAMVKPFVKLGATPKLFWVNVSSEVRKARLIARSAERDREKLEKLDEYLAQNPTKAPIVAHVNVDGSADFAKLVAELKDNV